MIRLNYVPDLASLMPVSLNGVSPDVVAECLLSGEYAIVQHGACYAVISRTGDTACIEMIEGPGGVELTAIIVAHARAAGLRCEGWVLSMSRARMAARCGMLVTGNSRISVSGKPQYQVTT